jgi:alcohol dehydrogenase class IV
MKLPAYITAYTGMDALGQCAECLVNTYSMPNLMAGILSREGLAISIEYLPKAVHNPDNEKAREMMSWAAMLSGYAITLRKTSSGHAIANQISDNYNLPHGVGVSCGMAALARYNIAGDPETTRIWAPYFGVELSAYSNMQLAGEEVLKRLDALQKDIGMKNMRELGIPKDFCDYAADMISKDRKWTIVPKAPDFELLRQCLHESWDY